MEENPLITESRRLRREAKSLRETARQVTADCARAIYIAKCEQHLRRHEQPIVEERNPPENP